MKTIEDEMRALADRARNINREIRVTKDLNSYRRLLHERDSIKEALSAKRAELIRLKRHE